MPSASALVSSGAPPQLCPVFKAAFYRVLRDSAQRDVDEKRRRLLRSKSGDNQRAL